MQHFMNYMMVTIFLLSLSTISFAQKPPTRYFTNEWLTKEVPKDKARYAQTVSNNADGTTTTEVIDLTNNLVIRSETYKGKEPYGVWKHRQGPRVLPADYNFELIYSKAECNDSIPKITDNYFQDNDSISYKAPMLKSNYNTISYFISRNIIYPSRAMNEDIQGTVYVMFTLTKEGIVEQVAITRGVHIILDKEAMQVIRQMKFATPPTLQGQPVALPCISVPIQFKIE